MSTQQQQNTVTISEIKINFFWHILRVAPCSWGKSAYLASDSGSFGIKGWHPWMGAWVSNQQLLQIASHLSEATTADQADFNSCRLCKFHYWRLCSMPCMYSCLCFPLGMCFGAACAGSHWSDYKESQKAMIDRINQKIIDENKKLDQRLGAGKAELIPICELNHLYDEDCAEKWFGGATLIKHVVLRCKKYSSGAGAKSQPPQPQNQQQQPRPAPPPSGYANSTTTSSSSPKTNNNTNTTNKDNVEEPLLGEKRFCPNCGNPYTEGKHKFCKSCGTNLKE